MSAYIVADDGGIATATGDAPEKTTVPVDLVVRLEQLERDHATVKRALLLLQCPPAKRQRRRPCAATDPDSVERVLCGLARGSNPPGGPRTNTNYINLSAELYHRSRSHPMLAALLSATDVYRMLYQQCVAYGRGYPLSVCLNTKRIADSDNGGCVSGVWVTELYHRRYHDAIELFMDTAWSALLTMTTQKAAVPAAAAAPPPPSLPPPPPGIVDPCPVDDMASIFRCTAEAWRSRAHRNPPTVDTRDRVVRWMYDVCLCMVEHRNAPALKHTAVRYLTHPERSVAARLMWRQHGGPQRLYDLILLVPAAMRPPVECLVECNGVACEKDVAAVVLQKHHRAMRSVLVAMTVAYTVDRSAFDVMRRQLLCAHGLNEDTVRAKVPLDVPPPPGATTHVDAAAVGAVLAERLRQVDRSLMCCRNQQTVCPL